MQCCAAPNLTLKYTLYNNLPIHRYRIYIACHLYGFFFLWRTRPLLKLTSFQMFQKHKVFQLYESLYELTYPFFDWKIFRINRGNRVYCFICNLKIIIWKNNHTHCFVPNTPPPPTWYSIKGNCEIWFTNV